MSEFSDCKVEEAALVKVLVIRDRSEQEARRLIRSARRLVRLIESELGRRRRMYLSYLEMLGAVQPPRSQGPASEAD